MQFLGFTGILEQDGAWGQTQGIGESKVPGGQGCHRNLKDPLGSLPQQSSGKCCRRLLKDLSHFRANQF